MKARVIAACATVAVLASGCVFTARVSTPPNNQLNNGDVPQAPAVSTDGRYVAFISSSTKLVTDDTNNLNDVFVRDMTNGTVSPVDVTNGGAQITTGSLAQHVAISGDGRYVLFSSSAAGIVSSDTNNTFDLFMRDRQLGTTTRVDLGAGGTQLMNGTSAAPGDFAISDNGRYITFVTSDSIAPADVCCGPDVYVLDRTAGTTTWVSFGNNNKGGAQPTVSNTGVAAFRSSSPLVAGDANNSSDIYIRSITAGAPTLVSLTSGGGIANAGSDYPAISANGNAVVFESLATNVVMPDTNNGRDVFVRDLVANTTARMNVSTAGVQANSDSACDSPRISGNGRYVAFDSDATNVVTPDNSGSPDVYVRDRLANTTTRVDEDQNGVQASGGFSDCVDISTDGRYVAFASIAHNIAGTDDGRWNVYLKSNPVPTVTSASPTSVAHGTSATITVNGTHLLMGATGVTAYFGADVTVTNTVRVSENQVKFSITVGAGATTGARTVTVYNPGTGAGTLAGASTTFTLTVT